jgi:hypothetical protein
MMTKKFNNSKPELDLVKARLGEIRMPAHERLLAEAHLARAEAIAEAIVTAARFVKRAVLRHVLRPIRRFAAALG